MARTLGAFEVIGGARAMVNSPWARLWGLLVRGYEWEKVGLGDASILSTQS